MSMGLNKEDKVDDGVNLLMSILVRYPEIGTISFDSASGCFKMAFMLTGIPNTIEFSNFKMTLLDSIRALQFLDKTKGELSRIELNTFDSVGILHIYRDVSSFSQSEIILIITLLRDHFRDILVSDYNDCIMEEELIAHEEMIENMLENMKQQQAGRNLIGIRENGRVFVFKK